MQSRRILGCGLAAVLGLAVVWSGRASASSCPAPTGPEAELISLVTLGEPPSRPFQKERFLTLLEQGVSPDTQNAACQSALLLATIAHAYLPPEKPDKASLLEAMRALVQRGADVNAQDNIGVTPVMMAIHRAGARKDIGPSLDALFASSRPLDLALRNVVGNTALGYLISWRQLEELPRFLAKGAPVDARDNFGTSILQTALAADSGTATAEALLARLTPEQTTALLRGKNVAESDLVIAATRAGNLAALRFLIEQRGLSPNAQNVMDETALQIARKRAAATRATPATIARFREVAEYLERQGARLPETLPAGSVHCDRPNPEPGDYDHIRRIIETCGLNSVEELLPLLPRSLRANYNLSYSPRGQQQGSFTHPRVILQGREGKTFVAFNGHPSHRGFQTIELIQLREEGMRARFELREIDFAEQGPARFSAANPPQCLACHGANAVSPRPFWDTWYVWPGFYFSEQEVLYPSERALHRRYIDEERRRGRYQHLLETADTPLEINDHWLGYLPMFKNQRMEQIIPGVMARVIASDLASRPALGPWRFALLGSMSCLEPIEEFVPAEAREHLTVPLPVWEARTARAGKFEYGRRVARHVSLLPGAPEGSYIPQYQQNPPTYGFNYDYERVAKLRYLLQAVGLDASWSTVFDELEDNFILRDLTWVENLLWKYLLSPERPVDARAYSLFATQYQGTPWFANYRPAALFLEDGETPKPGSETACAELRARSREALAGWLPASR